MQNADGVWSLYDFDPAVLVDFDAPLADVATLADAQGTCEVTTLTAPTATDACTTMQVTGTSDAVFPITATSVVTWTYDDGNGNTSTQTQNVVITDDVDPIAVAQDITVDLAGNNSVTILASDINNGSNDNCSAVSLSITPDTFTASGVYTVTLTATDNSGNTNTTTSQVMVDDTLSIEQPDLTRQIKIYPNPVASLLYIKTDLSISTMSIYDLTGKRLINFNEDLRELDLINLSSGVYFIKLTIENGSQLTQKIVKL